MLQNLWSLAVLTDLFPKGLQVDIVPIQIGLVANSKSLGSM